MYVDKTQPHQFKFTFNDADYVGPDINNGLLEVLLRFRVYEHAMAADIEAMYLQVGVPSRDRNALRFLWYDNVGQYAYESLVIYSVVFGVAESSRSILSLNTQCSSYCKQ